MRNYLEGWKEKEKVNLPPVRRYGFSEPVLLRTYEEPSRKTGFHVYIRHLKTGEAVEMTEDTFSIGKGSGNDFIVKNNSTVSRHHAQIIRTSGGYMLKDLKSTNHTFIEEKQIDEPVYMSNHTVFKLSDEEFEFLVKAGNLS